MKRLFIASIFCLITASLSAQFTLTDSLVAYYPFNGNADDESGNGHNGTIHGPSTTLDRFGNANSAYQFDGVDDYIESSTKIPITDFPVTVSVFIKIGSDIKGGTVYRSDYWDGYTDDTKGIGVSVENPGHVIGYFGTGNSTITFQSEYRIASRNWQHIAVVFENTDSVRIYFNGKESPWIKTNKSDKPFTTSGTLDKIGKDDDGLNRSVYEGAIDELRIYNRVLSSTEINDICSEDGFDPVDGEPVAYYPFNGNANDESGNGHDGTAYGPTLVPNRFGSQLSAYAFDGVNDSIILNRGNPIDVSGPMTIACWAKTDTTTNNHLPLISDYSSENGFYIYFTGDRTGPATWMASSNFQYYSDTDEKYDDGEWHHWAFTVAGIGQSDIYDAKLYIDAELSSTQFTESSIPVLLQNLGTIGAAGSTYFFKGVLDDIRIFNFELSEQEIQRVLFLDPKPHVDSIPPIFINVTTGILDSGDDVNVTISEEGVVYLVPSGTDPQLSNLRQAAKDSAKVLPYVEVILATDTILNGASLVVYAVDTKGNISEPSPVIAVRPIPRYDLAMVWISPDNPDCGTTREQAITVQISNSGPDTAPGYEVSYSIDNGENFITELINLPIASGQTREYQFIEKADMLADTSFSCISTVFVPDDIRTSNDTSIKQVHNNRIQIITETDSSVCKQKTGQANILTTLGGQPPYYYLWNTGDTTTSIDKLASGIYEVTLTDANGCTKTASVQINDADGPQLLNTTDTTHVTCHGENDGAIDLSISGGKTPYFFKWSDGSSTEDVSGLVAGTYDVIISDADTCSIIATFPINQPDAFKTSISTEVASCGQADGSASFSLTGGKEPFTYSWSAGGSGNSHFALPGGIHKVRFTDANNCSDSVTITINEIGAPKIAMKEIIPAGCGSPNGGINISTSSSTGSFAYLWSNGATTEDLINATPGEYSVTVAYSDSNCNSIASFRVPTTNPEIRPICLVSVDSITERNMIIWEKPVSSAAIRGFNIYRESSIADDYQLAGSTDLTQESIFIDLIADPELKPWRYRIKVVDTCGNESDLSEIHKTLHLTMNVGLAGSVNLIWGNYQGLSYSTYRIYRYNDAGEMTKIADVAGSSSISFNTYTDKNPPEDTYYYVIELETPACVSSKKASTHNTVRSNKSKKLKFEHPDFVGETGLAGMINIFPNPNKGEFKVRMDLMQKKDITIRIFNTEGRLINLSRYDSRQGRFEENIELPGIKPGLYHMQVIMGNRMINKPFVIE